MIDTGASCHMIGEGMLDGGHVEILEECAVSVECSLASGEPIILRRRVSLRACFVTCEGGLVCATLTALVAPSCNHAILSTGQMAQRGWQVSISDVGVEVKLGRGDQEVTLGATVFGNVGWCYTIPTRHYRVLSKASSHDNTHDNTHDRNSEAYLGDDGELRCGLGELGGRGGPSPKGHELRLPAHGSGADGSERGMLVLGDVASNVAPDGEPEHEQQQFVATQGPGVWDGTSGGWDGAAGDTLPSKRGSAARPAEHPRGCERPGTGSRASEKLDQGRRGAQGAEVKEKAPASSPTFSGEERDRGPEGRSQQGQGSSQQLAAQRGRDGGGKQPPKDSKRGEEEEGGLGATWPPSAKATRQGDCVPEAAAGGYQPATGATEEHATATKENARALGGQEEEAVPHASPEEIDSEAAGGSRSPVPMEELE